MRPSISKDFLIQQIFKTKIEDILSSINWEVNNVQLISLERDNYFQEILESIEPSYTTPEIKFDEKQSYSPDEFTVSVKIPVYNNPTIFNTIFKIAIESREFDKSILSNFNQEKKTDSGLLTFTGKTTVILASNPQMLESFKKSVEKNVKVINEFLEIYLREYQKIEEYTLIPHTKKTILNRITKLKNIEKNNDSLNNW